MSQLAEVTEDNLNATIHNRIRFGRLVWVLAAACGLTVANLYYSQPLLATIGQSFHVSARQAAFISTLTQFGYALGLLLIVPLGDRVERRRLILSMLGAVTLLLVLVALAPSITWLAWTSFILGVVGIVPQLLVPLAASLAPSLDRGRVVGRVMSGLLIGILLARTVSGVVGAHGGWRLMYWVAAGTMLVLGICLWQVLPESRPAGSVRYRTLYQSLWGLLRQEAALRQACIFGAMTFGAFSAFWTTLAFYLQTPPYHYGSDVLGLFGLVGVVGAVAASFVGHVADRGNPRLLGAIFMTITLLAYAVLWLFGGSISGLIIGVILLDLGAQANHISNQTRIFSLQPAARNRLNTVYMVSYFIGGSLGSALGGLAWSHYQWTGVCATGALLLLIGLAAFVLSHPQPRQQEYGGA